MDTIQLVQWINSLIKYHNIKAFYNSALWIHIRQEVLAEQHYECQVCKSKGAYSIAETVHHIQFLRKHPELALTKSNLLAVCKKCHNELHPEKHKWMNMKKKDRFINEEKW
ncbi:HNH endonuclease [Clostridium tyrobutyricum]|uniref:HNH endonuclease n=1 Tax=Clostridium tyrobutyricum TaxID=1519 RepID=UPI001C391519|nr:HNH endonuclease [Clostridium tyrobutyricum]MBV4424912.1 HNH endonuclease [Clostridium tyrobutyricum]